MSYYVRKLRSIKNIYENYTDDNIWTGASQYILVNCSNVQISSQTWLSTSLTAAIALYYSDNIDIRFSNISYQVNGITFIGCSDVRIYNNTMHHNNMGVLAATTTGGFVRHNEFYDGSIGIYFIGGVSDFDIYANSLQDFPGYGVVMEASSGNRIYHNTFVNCGPSSYGYDDTGNTWYNTTLSQGNYWSNWGGTGTYAIDGAAGSIDMFPLANPFVPPIVSEYIFLSWFAVVFLAIIPGLVIYLKKRR